MVGQIKKITHILGVNYFKGLKLTQIFFRVLKFSGILTEELEMQNQLFTNEEVSQVSLNCRNISAYKLNFIG